MLKMNSKRKQTQKPKQKKTIGEIERTKPEGLLGWLSKLNSGKNTRKAKQNKTTGEDQQIKLKVVEDGR